MMSPQMSTGALSALSRGKARTETCCLEEGTFQREPTVQEELSRRGAPRAPQRKGRGQARNAKAARYLMDAPGRTAGWDGSRWPLHPGTHILLQSPPRERGLTCSLASHRQNMAILPSLDYKTHGLCLSSGLSAALQACLLGGN